MKLGGKEDISITSLFNTFKLNPKQGRLKSFFLCSRKKKNHKVSSISSSSYLNSLHNNWNFSLYRILKVLQQLQNYIVLSVSGFSKCLLYL